LAVGEELGRFWTRVASNVGLPSHLRERVLPRRDRRSRG
jgi:hypothetical protein